MNLRHARTARFVPPLVAACLLTAPLLPAAALAGEGGEPSIIRAPMHLGKICDGENLADCFSFLGGGYLGVQLVGLTPELRAHFGIDESAGAMISKVVEDSPAERAGLEVGDIITRIDGEAMGSPGDIARHVRSKEEGESAEVEYWRGGRRASAYVEIEEREGLAGLGRNPFVIDLQDLGDYANLPFGFEGAEEALESAREALQGIDWSQHMKKLEEIDLGDLEERMEKLQEKMQELERRLEEDYGGER